MGIETARSGRTGACDDPRRARSLFRMDLPPVRVASGLDAAGIAIPVLASICFAISYYHGNVSQWRTIAHHLPRLGRVTAIIPELYWFSASVLLYLVVPVVALMILREPLREYGFGLGRWRLGLALSTVFLMVMIPGAIILSSSQDFSQYYPMARGAGQSLDLFIMYELGYVAYFVAWEHIFRNFLLFGLYRRMGEYAIYVTTMPFLLLHLGKPESEAFISLAASIAFSYLALWTRSFWWCVVVHVGVAVTMDVAAVWSRLFS